MPDAESKRLRELLDQLRVPADTKVELSADFDPAFKPGWLEKSQSEERLSASVQRLADYQQRLSAQDTHGVLVVLQGIDASGKDGTIRHVMSGVNPQGLAVHSFKVPSSEELAHDFLWRYQLRLPAGGQIAMFNRSHYEEVLVVRVHPELLARQQLPAGARKEDVWARRYREINDWEHYLIDNGIHVVKLFLNLSREEQRRRFLQRIEQPDKNWKFAVSDVQERAYWDDYQRAFSQMLSHTSTDRAPWFVIPADRKWFTRIAVAAVLVETLAAIDPQFPRVDPGVQATLGEARVQLEAEAPDAGESA